MDATFAATDLVVVSPVYWYSVAASVKLYLDYWSGWMRLPVDFKAKMRGKTISEVLPIPAAKKAEASTETEPEPVAAAEAPSDEPAEEGAE